VLLACIERGLLERLDLLTDEPSLLRATRDGLRYAGLGSSSRWSVQPERRVITSTVHPISATWRTHSIAPRDRRTSPDIARCSRGLTWP
jgi:hypothetical protein